MVPWGDSMNKAGHDEQTQPAPDFNVAERTAAARLFDVGDQLTELARTLKGDDSPEIQRVAQALGRSWGLVRAAHSEMRRDFARMVEREAVTVITIRKNARCLREIIERELRRAPDNVPWRAMLSSLHSQLAPLAHLLPIASSPALPASEPVGSVDAEGAGG